jgi:ACT domain-containing protein
MVGVSLEGIVSDLRIVPAGDGLVRILFRVDGRSGGLMATLDALRAAELTILDIQKELPTLERAFAHYAETEEPV